MKTLKPKLIDRNIVIATYEYLSNPTKDSFDLISPKDKSVQKHLIQKLSVTFYNLVLVSFDQIDLIRPNSFNNFFHYIISMNGSILK